MIAVLAAATAVTAYADTRTPRIKLNAADQAAARGAVIRRSDLDSPRGLSGGRTPPELEAWPTCSNYHPKVSDLLVTGAARSFFSSESPTVAYGSQVVLLQTAAMARRDWRRSLQPELVPCMRAAYQKDAGPGWKVKSAEIVPLSPIGSRSVAFRIAFSGPGKRNLVYTAIGFFSGRTEVTISAISPATMEKTATATALRLARVVAARIRAR
jgi:hypothetical protein